MMLANALRVLTRGAAPTAVEGRRASARSPSVDHPDGVPQSDGQPTVEVDTRPVLAALLLLDGISSAQLAASLREDPAPALELLQAALPAAVGLSTAIVGEREDVDAAAERLTLCIAVIQLLVPAAAASSSPLREGLREMLPLLASASRAPLLEPDTRERALAASISIATLPVAVAVPHAGLGGGAHPQEAAPDEADIVALREAAEELASEVVPLRAKGLSTIGLLFRRRSSAVMQDEQRLELIVSLCEAQLHHAESFVYQAALNALEAAAASEPSLVLPRLAQLLMPEACPRMPPATQGRPPHDSTPPSPSPSPSPSLTSSLTSANEHEHRDDDSIDASAERRLKAAQAICQAVSRLGETLPPNAEVVMSALLVGACDARQPAVRSSCLACMAEAAATLRFALHPWAVEVLQCVDGALEGETDDVARQASCYLVTTLLQSLGAEALTVLPAKQLASIYRRLRRVRDSAVATADTRLSRHACAALEQLRLLGLALVGVSTGDVKPRSGLTTTTNELVSEVEQLSVRMPVESSDASQAWRQVPRLIEEIGRAGDVDNAEPEPPVHSAYHFVGDGRYVGDGGCELQRLWSHCAWRPIAKCDGRYTCRERELAQLSLDSLSKQAGVSVSTPVLRCRGQGGTAEGDPIDVVRLKGGGGVVTYAKPDGTHVHTLNTESGLWRKLIALGYSDALLGSMPSETRLCARVLCRVLQSVPEPERTPIAPTVALVVRQWLARTSIKRHAE